MTLRDFHDLIPIDAKPPHWQVPFKNPPSGGAHSIVTQNYYIELAKQAIFEPLRLLVQPQIYYYDQSSFCFYGEVIYTTKKPVSCKQLKVWFQSRDGSYRFVEHPPELLMRDQQLAPGMYRFPFCLTLGNPSVFPSAPKSKSGLFFKKTMHMLINAHANQCTCSSDSSVVTHNIWAALSLKVTIVDSKVITKRYPINILSRLNASMPCMSPAHLTHTWTSPKK